MPSKLDAIAENGWRRAPASAAGAETSAGPTASQENRLQIGRTIWTVFAQFEARIAQDLGPKAAAMKPALARARDQLLVLFPADRIADIPGPERLQLHAKLAAEMDRIEDLVQALKLAPGAH